MIITSPGLKIAILGAGKIGSTFAFQLARSGGHDVTVIARPGSLRLQQLKRDDSIINVRGEQANIHITSSFDEQTQYDLVIVTVLAHQALALLPALQRSSTKCIQFMFNTFQPELFQEAVGSERCSFGMPFVQAMLDADGRLKATIGAGGQKTIMGRQHWVDEFNAAGLPAILERDMPLWLRCHAPVCVAFESVSVAGVRRGGGASWEQALVLARGIHACFGVIKGLGHPIYPIAKRLIDRSPPSAVAAMLWSMSRIRSFRELLATGETECRVLADAMAASAPPAASALINAMKPA